MSAEQSQLERAEWYKNEAGDWKGDCLAARARAEAAETALREIMHAARDLTTWRSDDALLVHVADLAARALPAGESSPNTGPREQR